MAKLVILDFDGTMFHTGPGIHKAVNETLKEMDHPELTYDEILECIGQGLLHLLYKLKSDFDKSPENLEVLSQVFQKHYENYFREHSAPYEGLHDFLRSWPHKLAIASNKTEYYIKEIIKHEPWANFPWVKVFGGDSLPTKKPDPAMILKIIKAAKVKPHEVVMVGDGEPDIVVAQEAGIKSIAVSYGYGDIQDLKELGADATIDSIDELPKTIDRLFT